MYIVHIFVSKNSVKLHIWILTTFLRIWGPTQYFAQSTHFILGFDFYTISWYYSWLGTVYFWGFRGWSHGKAQWRHWNLHGVQIQRSRRFRFASYVSKVKKKWKWKRNFQAFLAILKNYIIISGFGQRSFRFHPVATLNSLE